MRPLPAFAAAAAARFGAGEVVALAPAELRSSPSHRHYFACVREAWVNLPEGLAECFASEEHLRKYALIKAGYRDERSIVCTSKAEARRIAAFIRPIDDYSIITVSDTVVTQFTAKSQSVEAMSKAEFQASKDAVLGILAEMIGVDPTTLAPAPHRSAA
ncbi:MAG: hypothetical protein ACHQF3_16905 [Alphaproteobacteria bacterium]